MGFSLSEQWLLHEQWISWNASGSCYVFSNFEKFKLQVQNSKFCMIGRTRIYCVKIGSRRVYLLFPNPWGWFYRDTPIDTSDAKSPQFKKHLNVASIDATGAICNQSERYRLRWVHALFTILAAHYWKGGGVNTLLMKKMVRTISFRKFYGEHFLPWCIFCTRHGDWDTSDIMRQGLHFPHLWS